MVGGDSVLYLPLIGGSGEPFGTMVLIAKAPAFAESQRRLCEVFADRAAAAIENARLQEQTRRDAETRAMLLRELRHRVKNNLAGILGLLSMHRPQLSVEAAAWFDRVVERIRAMAGAHDLFSTGVDRVELSSLLEQVLVSVSAIKHPGVEVRTEFAAMDVMLSPPQAIALAMAVYELGSNAMVHAMSEEGGTMTVRTRHEAQRVSIEVIDDGPGWHGGSSDAADNGPGNGAACGGAGNGRHGSEGAGLTLVRELVGRELQGVFRMARGAEGGTVATIEFPSSCEVRQGVAP